MVERWLVPLPQPPTVQALTGALTTTLLALLLLGLDSAQARAHGDQALRKCGVADLAADACALASQLAAVAAVGEAVGGPWYQALSSDWL